MVFLWRPIDWPDGTIERILKGAEVSEDWRDDAACKDSDLNFFPDRGGNTSDLKMLCFACPVRLDCLEYALTTFQRHGIWGGLSERQRRKIRVPASGRGWWDYSENVNAQRQREYRARKKAQ